MPKNKKLCGQEVKKCVRTKVLSQRDRGRLPVSALFQSGCKFTVETGTTQFGPALSSLIFGCGDKIRFWSAGGLFVGAAPGSVLIQLEPNNILIDSGDANKMYLLGPDDPTRPAFYIDDNTGVLSCWEPTPNPCWISMDTPYSPNTIFFKKDEFQDGINKTSLGVTVTVTWTRNGSNAVTGFSYTVVGGSASYCVQVGRNFQNGTTSPFTGSEEIVNVTFLIEKDADFFEGEILPNQLVTQNSSVPLNLSETDSSGITLTGGNTLAVAEAGVYNITAELNINNWSGSPSRVQFRLQNQTTGLDHPNTQLEWNTDNSFFLTISGEVRVAQGDQLVLIANNASNVIGQTFHQGSATKSKVFIRKV